MFSNARYLALTHYLNFFSLRIAWHWKAFLLKRNIIKQHKTFHFLLKIKDLSGKNAKNGVLNQIFWCDKIDCSMPTVVYNSTSNLFIKKWKNSFRFWIAPINNLYAFYVFKMYQNISCCWAGNLKTALVTYFSINFQV